MGYWGIATGVIGSTELADGGVAGVDIADGTITSAKLATDDYFGNDDQYFVMCSNLVTGKRVTFVGYGTLILPTGGSSTGKAFRYCNETGALQWYNDQWRDVYGNGVNYFVMPDAYYGDIPENGAMYRCHADGTLHVYNDLNGCWDVFEPAGTCDW